MFLQARLLSAGRMRGCSSGGTPETDSSLPVLRVELSVNAGHECSVENTPDSWNKVEEQKYWMAGIRNQWRHAAIKSATKWMDEKKDWNLTIAHSHHMESRAEHSSPVTEGPGESRLHTGCAYGKNTKFGDGDGWNCYGVLWWTDGRLSRRRPKKGFVWNGGELAAVRFSSAAFQPSDKCVAGQWGPSRRFSTHSLSLSLFSPPIVCSGVTSASRRLGATARSPRRHRSFSPSGACHACAPLRAGVGR
jgi:hypothetical protein